MRIALATDAELPEGIPDEIAVRDALRERGCAAVDTPVWTDTSVDWSSYDLVVIRSTWDYTARLAEFRGWVDAVATTTTLRNAQHVVEWNTHKSYLRDLAERGVATVPTAWMRPGSGGSLTALLDQRGWTDAVAKAAVDGGARRARRVTRGDPAGQTHVDALLDDGHVVMVQPYVASVDGYGERALIYIDGELSHVVRKRAVLGSERLAEDEWPPPDAVAVVDDERHTADRVLAATREILGDVDLLYARVDLVRSPDGTVWLGELEVTEPYLFFAAAPREATERFADAMVRRARQLTS